MIYTHQFNGVQLSTGDIICTADGTESNLYGQFWRQMGRLIPGKIDHCALYVGPAGRCVEAGPGGVIVYEMPGDRWDADALADQRLFVDTLYGVAYPLAEQSLVAHEEQRIREGVTRYCLEQADTKKFYNFNFSNPDTENSFYCSQLVYVAYRHYGINLNTNRGMPSKGLLGRIVFPEEIWNACPHIRTEE